jgi:hypothetical protein
MGQNTGVTNSERAEILESPTPFITGARIIINAPASKIFDLLANPYMHSKLDGSAMVQSVAKGPERLSKGAKFTMKMKVGRIPYRVTNKVIEYRENEVIAWSTTAKQVWRYELEPVGPNEVAVTEWSDGTGTRFKPAAMHNIRWSAKAMAKSLVNLKRAVEDSS